jgi:23S rRNA (cytosine1962-C5)-methyltransferase
MATVFLGRATMQPNVFRKRIERVEGTMATGDWVRVCHLEQPEAKVFAYGLYNERSEIPVRLASWWGQRPDEAYWDRLLDQAVELRHQWLGLPKLTDAYRVIHAEADGFPGLAVDRYGDVLSAEVFSMAMYLRCRSVMEGLSRRLGTRHWLVQPSPLFHRQEGYDVPAFDSGELPKWVQVREAEAKFRIQFESGHKTGFFCDQRDNRLRLKELSPGRSVLDLCCYTGGFSVQAALGGASEVIGVDLDEAPLQLAKKNADVNQVRVRYSQSDAFAYLRDLLRTGKQFDIVVLDPPKLIRNRDEHEEGAKKHFDLNRLAIQLVKTGGWMLTCSCAGLLSWDEFYDLVSKAARAGGWDADGVWQPPRRVQIVSRTGAPPDHPVASHCPQSEYLKSLWLRVY